MFLVKCGRCLGLTTLPPSVRSLICHNHIGPLWELVFICSQYKHTKWVPFTPPVSSVLRILHKMFICMSTNLDVFILVVHVIMSVLTEIIISIE
jgi:hypothetical protein